MWRTSVLVAAILAGCGGGANSDAGGTIRITTVEFSTSRWREAITSGGSLRRERVDAPSGSVYLSIGFELDPPAPLPELPAKVTSFFNDAKMTLTREGLKDAREHLVAIQIGYRDEIDARTAAVADLAISLRGADGTSRTLVRAPVSLHTKNSAHGSADLFNRGGKAEFVVSRSEPLTLWLAGYRSVGIDWSRARAIKEE